MKDIVKILESHPLLKTVSRNAIEHLAWNAGVTRYKKGDVVHEEGVPSRFLYLVLDGMFEASRTEDAGHEYELRCYGVGDFFGERGIFNNDRRKHCVRSLSDGALLRISGENISRLLTDHEKLATTFQNQTNNRTLFFSGEESEFRASRLSIINFVDLSEMLSEEHLTNICNILHRETGERILLVQFFRSGGAINLSDLGPELIHFDKSKVNGSGFFMKPEDDLPFLNLKVNLGDDERTLPYLQPFLNLCSKYFRYVLLLMSGETARRTVLDSIKRADSIYLSLSQKGSALYNASLLLRDMRFDEGRVNTKIKPILMLGKGETPSKLEDIENKIGMKVCTVFRTEPSDIFIPKGEDYDFENRRRYNAQFRRIAREIGRCRVGLVLSSGSAKGFAHIGVIQVLEENGIEVDFVVGSSIGSYVSSCWAHGYNGNQLEKLAYEYNSKWGLMKLIDPVFPPRLGAIGGKKLRKRILENIGTVSFDDLSMPLRVIATKLSTLERVAFENGEVASAVQSSCCMPGICRPVFRDGELYIDGGITDPLPVDVLEEIGVEKIIAVSVVPTMDHSRKFAHFYEFQQTPLKPMERFWRFVNKHMNYFAPGNVFDILMRSFEAGQIRIVERDLLRAHVVLQPITEEGVWHEFTNPGKYIALGRKAAEEQLESLRDLTMRKAS